MSVKNVVPIYVITFLCLCSSSVRGVFWPLSFFTNNSQSIPQKANQSWEASAVPSSSSHASSCNTTVRAKAIDIAIAQSMHPSDLEAYCSTMTDQELFAGHHFYACANYMDCIRRRSGYEDYILNLHHKIHSDHGFRKKLRYMVGFKGKKGFQDFIDGEVGNIQRAREVRIQASKASEIKRQQEKQPRLCVTDRAMLENLQNQSIQLQNNTNPEYASRCQQRADAFKKTVSSNGACCDYSLQVAHPAFIDECAEVFKNCYGTALDKQLHEELCATRTTMMQLQSSNSELVQVKSISPVVYHFTALAKEQSNPVIAFNISDFCYHLTKVAQGFSNAATIVFKGVGKGVCNTVEHSVALCQALATHPIDDIAKPLCRAGIALGQAVYYATELAITSPEMFSKKTKDVAISLGRYVCDKPEEALATVVECLLPLKAPNIVKLKQVQSVVRAVQDQEIFARALQCTSNIATKITMPIKQVLTDAAALVDVGIQRGKAAMHNLIKVAEQQPELLSVGDIAALKVPSECFNDFEKLSKDVASRLTKDVAESGKINDVLQVTWINHGNKHVPQANMSWKDIVKTTKDGGAAKYSPEIRGIGNIKERIKALETHVWKTGISVAYNNQNYKIKSLDFICGAFEGEATSYILVKESSGTFHGHPISEARYRQLLKKAAAKIF